MISYLIFSIIDFNNISRPVILLDWSGFNPKSTPYAKKLVELYDSNASLD